MCQNDRHRIQAEERSFLSIFSSLHQFFDDLIGEHLLLTFGLKLFNELIGLLLTPLVSHCHKKLFEFLAFDKAFILLVGDFKGFGQLLLSVLFNQLLEDYQVDIQIRKQVLSKPIPYSTWPSYLYQATNRHLQNYLRSSYLIICPIETKNYLSSSQSKRLSSFRSNSVKLFLYFSYFSNGKYFYLVTQFPQQIFFSYQICLYAGTLGRLSVRATFSLATGYYIVITKVIFLIFKNNQARNLSIIQLFIIANEVSIYVNQIIFIANHYNIQMSSSQWSSGSSSRNHKRNNSKSSSSPVSEDEEQIRKIQQKLQRKAQIQRNIQSRTVRFPSNQNNQQPIMEKLQAMEMQHSGPIIGQSVRRIQQPINQLSKIKLEGSRKKSRSRSRSRDKDKGKKWFIYEKCEQIKVSVARFPANIIHLPIFKKKNVLIEKMISNQFTLVTGQTGCGKSTQVPRLIYEYLRVSGSKGNILCVQPRRLAVLNLYQILQGQMQEKNLVGFQISMQTKISAQTKILFMTNGIFLQRLVHSTQLFEEYPFIILDQVHERDIDTDFILLAIKRIARKHPKLRVILMSATIDNQLFRYYFAEDHIDKFMNQENFYMKVMRKVQQQQMRQQENQEFGMDSDEVKKQQKMYKEMGLDFMKSKCPCPVIEVTQTGKFKKEIYYLDNLHKFIKHQFSTKWGSALFSEKYPNTHKELFQVAVAIIEQIIRRSEESKNRDHSYSSVLIFLPGLLEIETLGAYIQSFFGRQRTNKLLEILQVHSSILTEDLTRKLHSLNRDRIKIILATNIAQSSITVMGVQYVIDFCLSKQVHFDQKSRMENLELIWASQASCDQRAGRTGRVCNGFVFRLVEHKLYQKLPKYSTPQIQRSSLDRVILRIKMIHDTNNSQIFAEPGDVLGTAIQPPKLKHIDEAVKSLLFCGGLKIQGDKFLLTPLGRLYIDLPIDIAYSKMLVMSLLFGTFEDTLIIVAILSQNKNPFKKQAVQNNYLDYFELIKNEQRCDFTSLIRAYKQKLEKSSQRYQSQNSFRSYSKNTNRSEQIRKDRNKLDFDIFKQAKILIDDLYQRVDKKGYLAFYRPADKQHDYKKRFKFTLIAGFLNKFITVRQPIYDEKQQKRVNLMKKKNIQINNTITLINSTVIRRTSFDGQAADERLISHWKNQISNNLRINPQNFSITLTEGLSYLHFKRQQDLNTLLFMKYMEDNKRTFDDRVNTNESLSITPSQLLKALGDLDHMQQGTMFTMSRDRRIAVDNFSQNRVVQVHSGQQKRFLMTNTIMQQSSRLFCRFTSLLPDMDNIDAICYLVFYPNIILQTDEKVRKFQSLYLKSKTRLQLSYDLNKFEINQANQIRKIMRHFLTFDFRQFEKKKHVKKIEVDEAYSRERQDLLPKFAGQKAISRQEMQIQKKPTQITQTEAFDRTILMKEVDSFWALLDSFIDRKRIPLIDENKWLGYFFKDCNINIDQGQQMISKPYRRPKKVKNPQLQEQKDFMNEIKVRQLQDSYFSSSEISQLVRRQRIQLYNQWKISKIAQCEKLRQKGLNKTPYLCCAVCKLPISLLDSVSSINNEYFRDLYKPILSNIKNLPFDQMGDYFCSLLMGLNFQKSYQLFGCKNDHHFGIQFDGQKYIKILRFSDFIVKFPDQSQKTTDFDKLDVGKWFKDNEQAKRRRDMVIINQYCFICNQNFQFYKEVQKHFREPFHDENVAQFKKGMKDGPNVKYQV